MIFNTLNSPFKDFEKMDFSKKIWLEIWYPKICNYLKINPEEDLKALKFTLNHISSTYSTNNLRSTIKNKRVFAIAPGIFLEKELEKYIQNYESDENIVISANGATSYLLSRKIIPNIIVSDLDGNADDQLEAQNKGSILLLHIHGDNYKKIQAYFNAVSNGKLIITTQIKPLTGTFNFFGFTDGDRIVCLSTFMKAKEIILLGFDFGSEIGKYSKNGSIDEDFKTRKMKKFVIGKSIINWCSNTGQPISFLSDIT